MTRGSGDPSDSPKVVEQAGFRSPRGGFHYDQIQCHKVESYHFGFLHGRILGSDSASGGLAGPKTCGAPRFYAFFREETFIPAIPTSTRDVHDGAQD